MKPTVKNVIDLWFAEDTPIHQYRVRLNPELWAICGQISQDFKAPSGRLRQEQFRRSDKICFAQAVLQVWDKNKVAEEDLYDMAQS